MRYPASEKLEIIRLVQPGELLHAAREPRPALDRMKVDLGSASFSAL